MRLTEEEYKELAERLKTASKKPVNASYMDISKKPSKYHNRKVLYTDPTTKEEITFDSEKERDYYLILKDRERRGEIYDVKRQVEIEIQRAFADCNGKKYRPITYIADFTYLEPKVTENNGVYYRKHVVDVKGFRTDVYRLKRKLLAFKGILIEEV